MNNLKEYKELFAFHPGYYISEVIEDMCISQAEFAIRMGTTPKTLSLLINGQSNLTNDLAMKIATMLGTSVDVWLNLQKTYDEKIIEIDLIKNLDEQKRIINMIDYSYFVEVANLPSARTKEEKISNLCTFFKISDLRILKQPDFLVNFRNGISDIGEKNIINSQAWVQVAMNCAKNISVAQFDSVKLTNFLPEIRKMTVENPSIFIPRLKQMFSDCGVAFVLLPHLKNSGVNGAVKWFGHNQVVLAMNNRRCYADTFWFSLFHEIKHVLQQKVKTVFISGDLSVSNIDSSLEKEADNFSKNFIIPLREFQKWAPNMYVTDSQIVEFANKIGIHPGVVVGRLQHDGIIPQNRCSQLKVKYKIVIN